MVEPLILVADDEDAAHEAVMRLARVGFENAIGYITSFDDLPARALPQISVGDLPAPPPPVLDVPHPGEYAAGHVLGAQNEPLEEFSGRLHEAPRDRALAA